MNDRRVSTSPEEPTAVNPSPTLPNSIQNFVDATNSGDSDGFVEAFTADAHLDDWGRHFHGHNGLRSWDGTDNIGVRAHFEVVSVETVRPGVEYVVTLAVSGDGHNGTGPMRFVLRDGLIAELVIT